MTSKQRRCNIRWDRGKKIGFGQVNENVTANNRRKTVCLYEKAENIYLAG